MGLLGNKPDQFGAMNSLLGIDPAAMRRQALFNGLAAAGFTLMGDKNIGNAGGAFLQGTNQGREAYMNTALDAYRLKTAEEERQYGRERDAQADARWQEQFDYNKGRQQKADAWQNTQMDWQMQDRQQQEDMRMGQQNQVQDWMGGFEAQGGNLFSPEMQMGLRQQGIQGVDPRDTQKYNRMQPLAGAGMYPQAFEQMMTQPGKGNWTTVGKDSTLFNEDTGEFMTPPQQQGGGRAIDDPMKIGKDYQSQPGFQRLKEVAPTIESMVKSLEDPSAMADLDFVYGLAKILDPTSVVRESEAGMVIDSQGIAPSLLGQLNKILTGEQAMLPETRRKLVSVAIRRAKEFETQAQQERGFYGNMAQENNFNPDTYLQPVPAIPGIPGLPSDDDGWSVLPNGTRIRERAQ